MKVISITKIKEGVQYPVKSFKELIEYANRHNVLQVPLVKRGTSKYLGIVNIHALIDKKIDFIRMELQILD